jgi:DNA-binding LacI/PurR family transcriptional regulator
MNEEVLLKGRPRSRVKHGLRRWIETGRLPAGEPLPSMQSLGRAFRVSPTTVMAAVRELEKDGLLRALANGTRVTVAVPPPAGESLLSHAIVLLTDTDVEHRDPVLDAQAGGWEAVVDYGVVAALRSRAQHFMVLHAEGFAEKRLAALLRDPPRGVIITGSVPSELARQTAGQLLAAKVPVTMTGTPTEVEPGADSVGSDHRAGAHALTRWLIARGCRRILRYWAVRRRASRPGWLALRDAGYEQACREAGVDVLPAAEFATGLQRFPLCREDIEEDGCNTAGRLWQHLRGPQPVDAIMAVSDGIATGVASACRVLGLVPNRDVLIAGYDNYWGSTQWREWEPCAPAATVDKQNAGIGRELVQVLLARTAGTLPPEPQHRLVEPKLIVNL